MPLVDCFIMALHSMVGGKKKLDELKGVTHNVKNVKGGIANLCN